MLRQTRQLKKVPVQTEAPQYSEAESTFQNQMSVFYYFSQGFRT